MSKRGRTWAGKLKKKLGSDKLSGLKDSIALKKKATKEQLGKIKTGVSSYTDVLTKQKEMEKLYKETGEAIYKEKHERISEILKLLKHMKIKEAKMLGEEYDRLYPNDF